MKLESLSISPVSSWEPNYKEDSYKGRIKYVGQHGAIEINLTPEFTKKLIAIIAEDLVVASKEVANNLTADVLNHAALPAPASAVEYAETL